MSAGPEGLTPYVTGPGEQVLRRLRTRPSGLSTRDAADRLVQYGPNVLTRRKTRSWWRQAAEQFTHPLALLLEAAAVLAFVSASIVLGWTILAVVLLNAAFALAQERHAERSVEALREYLPSTRPWCATVSPPRSRRPPWCRATSSWSARARRSVRTRGSSPARWR
ncbi:cation-transporting P-type ATPase [Nocardioides mesophilus]|uniref:cation-transporting P-type ATPase n=1 Tax=Nocardioides mesophilus TaxID=433659 RepID=UPI001FE4E898|nr:cation-transporting P-type ATPase [Nocardioides mesophilus]